MIRVTVRAVCALSGLEKATLASSRAMPRFIRHTVLAGLALSFGLLSSAHYRALPAAAGIPERPVLAARVGSPSETAETISRHLAGELYRRLSAEGGCTLDPRTG